MESYFNQQYNQKQWRPQPQQAQQNYQPNMNYNAYQPQQPRAMQYQQPYQWPQITPQTPQQTPYYPQMNNFGQQTQQMPYVPSQINQQQPYQQYQQAAIPSRPPPPPMQQNPYNNVYQGQQPLNWAQPANYNGQATNFNRAVNNQQIFQQPQAPQQQIQAPQNPVTPLTAPSLKHLPGLNHNKEQQQNVETTTKEEPVIADSGAKEQQQSALGPVPEDWMPLFYDQATKFYTNLDEFKVDATEFYNNLWFSRGYVPPMDALETESFKKNFSEPIVAQTGSWTDFFNEMIWGATTSEGIKEEDIRIRDENYQNEEIKNESVPQPEQQPQVQEVETAQQFGVYGIGAQTYETIVNTPSMISDQVQKVEDPLHFNLLCMFMITLACGFIFMIFKKIVKDSGKSFVKFTSPLNNNNGDGGSASDNI